jgi:hypothetical protein
MKIELIRLSDRSIKLSINNNSNSEDLQVWHKIATDIILLACINKAVSLITIDPVKGSIGYEFKSEKLTYHKRSYLLSNILSFRAIDALNLGDSSDWQLGLTVILLSTYNNEINIPKLFPASEEDIGCIQQSILFCSNDGYSLYLLNVDQPFDEAISRIRQIVNLYQVIM